MTRLRTNVLAVLAALLLAFGCAQHQSLDQRLLRSLDDLDALIDTHVPDPERAAVVHGLITQFRDLAQGFYDAQVNASENAYRMNRNYNAEPREFEDALLRLQQRRLQTYGQITVLALEARTFVSRDEWESIHRDLRESRDG